MFPQATWSANQDDVISVSCRLREIIREFIVFSRPVEQKGLYRHKLLRNTTHKETLNVKNPKETRATYAQPIRRAYDIETISSIGGMQNWKKFRLSGLRGRLLTDSFMWVSVEVSTLLERVLYLLGAFCIRVGKSFALRVYNVSLSALQRSGG